MIFILYFYIHQISHVVITDFRFSSVFFVCGDCVFGWGQLADRVNGCYKRGDCNVHVPYRACHRLLFRLGPHILIDSFELNVSPIAPSSTFFSIAATSPRLRPRPRY